MEQRAQLGASIRIKGEFSAKEDVVIAGHIEGTINVEGHLVIVEGCAELEADIVARAIVVSGTLKGSLYSCLRSNPVPGPGAGVILDLVE